MQHISDQTSLPCVSLTPQRQSWSLMTEQREARINTHTQHTHHTPHTHTHTHTHTHSPAFLSAEHHAHRKLKHAHQSHICLSWPKNLPQATGAVPLHQGRDTANELFRLKTLLCSRHGFTTHEDMHLLDS